MREPSEGFVEVPGGRVWYTVASTGGQGVPLLGLHGGPGFTHDTLRTLEGLAPDRPVVLFDQLGSGRSDRPGDPDLYRLERYVEEVARVRDALQLDRIHLLGHSWGGTLALSYLSAVRPAWRASSWPAPWSARRGGSRTPGASGRTFPRTFRGRSANMRNESSPGARSTCRHGDLLPATPVST
jgi:alpha-beta hydrolase superfamily lysophospholipase